MFCYKDIEGEAVKLWTPQMWQEAEHWQQNIYLRAHVLINKYVWNPYYVAGAGGREVAGGSRSLTAHREAGLSVG
jgi:hypothetical protein